MFRLRSLQWHHDLHVVDRKEATLAMDGSFIPTVGNDRKFRCESKPTDSLFRTKNNILECNNRLSFAATTANTSMLRQRKGRAPPTITSRDNHHVIPSHDDHQVIPSYDRGGSALWGRRLAMGGGSTTTTRT